MIYVRIKGGVGNQLFHYALARNLALKHETPLRLDLSWFKLNPYRAYELDRLNIAGESVTSIWEHFGLYQLRDTRGRRARIAKMVPKILPGITYITNKHFPFKPEVLESPDNVYLDGTWQTEKYFANIAPTIRKEFTLKNPSGYFKSTSREMQSVESVSLHVRRGDYADNPKVLKSHGLMPREYYGAAVGQLSSQVENPEFYVFSDDIAWVKAHIPIPFTTHYIEHPEKKDCEEIVLMAACKHQIIANSSFSWWGAWLNPNPEKIVIAPKIWFVDGKYDTRDLIPTDWLKL